MSSLTFSAAALSALTVETPATPMVLREVEAMLYYRRGAAGSPLILIVNELTLCHSLQAGLYGLGATYAENACR